MWSHWTKPWPTTRPKAPIGNLSRRDPHQGAVRRIDQQQQRTIRIDLDVSHTPQLAKIARLPGDPITLERQPNQPARVQRPGQDVALPALAVSPYRPDTGTSSFLFSGLGKECPRSQTKVSQGYATCCFSHLTRADSCFKLSAMVKTFVAR